MTTYDDWKLASPPYYEEPDPWEGRECRDCDHFCYLRDKDKPLCIQDAVDNGSLFVDEVNPADSACEAFKEI